MTPMEPVEPLDPATIRLARHLGYLYGETDEPVISATARAIVALAAGSVYAEVDEDVAHHLRNSPMVAAPGDAWDRPLVLDGRALYLTRYWAEQESIVDRLRVLLAAPHTAPSPPEPGLDESQAAAVAMATSAPFSVIAGGPGTGKTTVVARIVAALQAGQAAPLRVILAAPTGRAAARLDQAVHAVAGARITAGTLHRVLGIKPWGAIDHDAGHPLAADVVVVDEASMLSLHLMAQLLQAIAPPTRLILLGDPDQLASVEAGAVLADIVANAGTVPVTRLTHTYRYSGDIADLAEATRRGDADAVLGILGRDSAALEWDRADPSAPGFAPDSLAGLHQDATTQGQALIAAGRAGDAIGACTALGAHRLLLAHRHGPTGVSHWSDIVRRWVTGGGTPGWYPGLPILITRNDDVLGVYNGDTGVIVATPGGVALALDDPAGPRLIAPDLVAAWEPLYASTIHKAQGSQYDAVSLILPPPETALATRELFYTAVTRARTYLRIVGTPAAIAHAVTTPALRASGLAGRLAAISPRTTG